MKPTDMATGKEIPHIQIGAMTYPGSAPSLAEEESLTSIHEAISAYVSAHTVLVVLGFARISTISSMKSCSLIVPTFKLSRAVHKSLHVC